MLLPSIHRLLALEKKLENQSSQTASLHQIANIYSLQGDIGKSLALYKEALVIEKGNRRICHSS